MSRNVVLLNYLSHITTRVKRYNLCTIEYDYRILHGHESILLHRCLDTGPFQSDKGLLRERYGVPGHL